MTAPRRALAPPPFLDPPRETLDPARARASVIPVPYDATSTWVKGADAGPAAILDASAQVEWFDHKTRTEPHARGIITLPMIEHAGSPDELAPRVEAIVGGELDAGRLPCVLGGEHSVSIGAIRAAAARYPGLTVLQIDAHADTREAYEGSACNHACVMARAREVARTVQVGIRSLDASEFPALDNATVFWADDIRRCTREERQSWHHAVVALCTERVYLTIDLDAFDPSIIPATGTPEPGGLDWDDVDGLVTLLARSATIVGFDVVELAPQPGQHASAFTAAKLVHRVFAEALHARET
ncbi:MAG: agmatinase [Planctomycetota bacterium]